MKTSYYIGLDVHKDSIAIAYTKAGERKEPTYFGECGGSVLAAERCLRRLAKKLGIALRDLKVCYEAGPSGFVLARRFLRLGLECVVMSPSKSERKPNEKIKTDKRDAIHIAKAFRNGDITVVRVPPALDEAVRDLCRARTDASDDLSRAKQRLNSFLLRNGFHYSGKARWTPSHLNYLRHLTLPDPVQNLVLEEPQRSGDRPHKVRPEGRATASQYLQAIDAGYERVERLATRMKEVLADWEWEPVVRALMACKGFQEVAAMTLISELGDLRRFDHPRKLMAFLGLVPGEYSSGSKRRQNSIWRRRPAWRLRASPCLRQPISAPSLASIPNAPTPMPAGCSSKTAEGPEAVWTERSGARRARAAGGRPESMQPALPQGAEDRRRFEPETDRAVQGGQGALLAHAAPAAPALCQAQGPGQAGEQGHRRHRARDGRLPLGTPEQTQPAHPRKRPRPLRGTRYEAADTITTDQKATTTTFDDRMEVRNQPRRKAGT